MIEIVPETFACTLRHLVAGWDRFLGAAARLLGAVRRRKEEEEEEGWCVCVCVGMGMRGGGPH